MPKAGVHFVYPMLSQDLLVDLFVKVVGVPRCPDLEDGTAA